MVNRMVFFYVYVIADRFTSDFGESLRPVLFFPPQSPKTPMIHDLILEEQKRERLRRKPSLRHSLFVVR